MTSTHKHHIISIQYPSHKCLPEKSCLYCLRILIMSWLFKDLVVIMKQIMSWLFKYPINGGLAQSNYAQSNSKKWPKGYKYQIVPNEFFPRKTTNKVFMYLLAPFILQNLKKIIRANPELWGCAIFGPKMAHLPGTKFFGTNHYYYFHLPISPFHCAKFKKK